MSLRRAIFAVACSVIGSLAGPGVKVSRMDMPMAFEANHGQAPEAVRFAARGLRYRVHLSAASAKLHLGDPSQAETLEMTILGAGHGAMTPDHLLPGKSHYLLGNDPSHWRTNIPQFDGAWVRGIYPGIDLHYYGNQRNLEYDFVVAPKIDPRLIRLRFRGQTAIRTTPEGDLVFDLGAASLRKRRPAAFTEPGHTPVTVDFLLNDDGSVGFTLGPYDNARKLVIDPVIDFASYLGGTGTDVANAVAVDGSGNVYVGGKTGSTAFPSVGPLQALYGGSSEDGFVTKFNSTGTAVLFSTYLGGNSRDAVNGIAIDASGSIYLTGETLSGNFPKTSPVSTSCFGDAFVTKLAPAGNAITYSLCVGGAGTDLGWGIGVDSASNVYISGESGGGLPVANAAQAAWKGYTDAFVGKLNPAGSAWSYLTYLGGAQTDRGSAIAVDGAGNACVAGSTSSTDFTVVAPLLSPSPGSAGVDNAFVAKFSPSGSIFYSTYLGGSGVDSASSVGIDALGSCFVTGYTWSTNFPVLNAAQPARVGTQEAFVTAYNPSGSAYLYSTYLGGSLNDIGRGIAVTAGGVAHVTGESSSGDFPKLNPAQTELKDYGSIYKSSNGGAAFSRPAPIAGSFFSIAAHPTDPLTLFAGTSAGGIYKSTNAGASWTLSNSGIAYFSSFINSLVFHPLDSCLIYSGNFSQPFPFLNTNEILMRSNNCGASWGIAFNAPIGNEVNSLAFSSAASPVLYFGWTSKPSSFSTQTSVGRMTGSGSEYSYPGAGYYVLAADPLNGCNMYVGNGVFNGTGTVLKNTSCSVWNWAQVGATFPSRVSALAAHPTIADSLLAGTGTGEIYRKADAGSPWVQVATLSGNVSAIRFEPGNPAVVYAAGNDRNVHKSTDGGITWNPVGAVAGSLVYQLTVSPAAPATIYAASSSASDAFYTRISANGAILDSTHLGGYGTDAGLGIALDSGGNAVIAGSTASTTFPVTPGAVYASNAGSVDGFVVKLKPAAPCTYSINPATGSPGSAGGTGNTAVTAGTGCPWTAVSNANWITVTSGASGSGNGSVGYSVAANASPAQRSGSITIADKTLTITQAAAPCTFQISSSSVDVAAAGGAGSAISVTAIAGCAWTAVSNAAWITVTSGATGNGPGSVGYTVGANAVAAVRSGTITLAGFTFTVNQAAASSPQVPSARDGGPIAPAGTTQTIVARFSHPAGVAQLGVVNILINEALDGANACYIAYSRPAGVLFLVHDAGTGSGLSAPLVLGSAGSASNSQCSIAGLGSSVVESGNSLTLTLVVSFTGSFTGNRVIYMAAQSVINVSSGWQTMGTSIIPEAALTYPRANGLSLPAATAASQTITVTYQDAANVNNLQTAWLLINMALDARQSCYIAYYLPGNLLFLYPDNGDGAQATAIELSGTNTIENSYCRISAQGSSAVRSGNQLTLTLNYLAKPAFTGARGIWGAVQTLGAQTSRWKPVGAWLVP